MNGTGTEQAYGLWLLAAAWKVLYEAQRARRLATTGAYARPRHPQYLGFILIMTGFLPRFGASGLTFPR